MATITVHAGDFKAGTATFMFGNIGFADGTSVPVKTLKSVEKASEESVKKLGGTVAWGAAGAALLGPVGLLAGLLLGGKKTEVTFIAMFMGDKKMLATTDGKTYTKLMAAAMS